MPRRPRAEERQNDHDAIELVRSGRDDTGTSELVQTGLGLSRSIGIAFAAVAVIGFVALALRSTPDPEPTSPTSPDPEADAAPDEETEVLLGPGPDLEWEQIIWNIRTGDFRWIGDGFVGDNGVTEWRIKPTLVDTAIQQRQSLQLAYPDHYPVDAEGVQAMAPRVDQPDHLLLFLSWSDADEPVRVDLPTRPPVTDLVVRQAEIQAAVVGDAAVIVIERSDRVNPAVLGQRIGRDLVGRQPTIESIDSELRIRVSDAGEDDTNGVITVALDDVDFSVTELEALRPRDPQLEVLAADLATATTGPPGIVPDGRAELGVAGNRFVLAWGNGDVAEHVSTSVDGRSWQPSASRVGITEVSGDATSIVGIEQATGNIARSGNGATSWQYTVSPFPRLGLTVTRDHVAIRELATGDALDPSTRYEIGLNGYDLVISDGGQTFELIDPTAGDVVSGGRIGDPVTGAAYDRFDGGLTVIDPATGETIVVSAMQLDFAFATTGGSASRVPRVGFARWDGGLPPVWRIETADEAFHPAAVDIDFVSGGGHLLAVVTTTNGYVFYITEID